ncbi:MAG: hypothetical protein JRN62_03715 [Nitrososphaerota archaeon]|jgi:hypothetical protein|nr:hypothetical protein [Nitrososphaerota archaeon]MDG6948709.1 hypothetical protein [Nitrososphaerota archaeon]
MAQTVQDLKQYKKQLEEEVRDGVGCLKVTAYVPTVDSIPVSVVSLTLTISGKLPWEAKKIVRLLKDNGLD